MKFPRSRAAQAALARGKLKLNRLKQGGGLFPRLVLLFKDSSGLSRSTLLPARPSIHPSRCGPWRELSAEPIRALCHRLGGSDLRADRSSKAAHRKNPVASEMRPSAALSSTQATSGRRRLQRRSHFGVHRFASKGPSGVLSRQGRGRFRKSRLKP